MDTSSGDIRNNSDLEFSDPSGWFTPEECVCINARMKAYMKDGKDAESALSAAISSCAPSKAKARSIPSLVGAGTFSATTVEAPPKRIKINGGNYRWMNTHDGYFTVFDVPIMAEIPKGTKGAPYDIDRSELEHYVKVAQERYHSGRFAATCFKGHNSDIPITNPDFLGYILPNRVGLYRMEDGPKWTLFADIKLREPAFQAVMRGELPYHSPEIPWDKRRISGLALLDTMPPFFEFELFTLGDEITEAELKGKRAEFSSVVHDLSKFLEGDFAMPDNPNTAKCAGCEKKDEEIQLLKKMASEAEERAKKFEAELCNTKSMKGAADNEKTDKDEDEDKKKKDKKGEESDKKDKMSSTSPADQVPSKTSPIPAEPGTNPKEGKMSIPDNVIAMFAERDAKLAAMQEAVKRLTEEAAKKAAEETRRARVAAAKSELAGFVLSSDIDETLATFADDEAKLKVYVASLKKNAQKQPPTSLADFKGLGPVETQDPALAKFAQQGPDVLEKAQKFAAMYRESLRLKLPLSMSEEQYIEFNLKNSQ